MATEQGEDLRKHAFARIAEIGPKFDGQVLEETRALYEPYLDLSMPEGGELHTDVAYGDDPRQKLDLYLARPGGPETLLVYVPGGGFTGGDKNAYGALGAWFARNGVSTAVINYRLAPDHPWPSGPQDVDAAVTWLGAELGSYGRQTMGVALFGQSAGAAHVAGYLAGHARKGHVPHEVAEAILMSGFYEMTPEHGRAPNLTQYFGTDPALYPERSPINGVEASRTPVSLWFGEYDPPFLATPSLDMARRITLRDGKCPPTYWLEGHNHVSTVLAIGSPADDVGPMILERIRRLG